MSLRAAARGFVTALRATVFALVFAGLGLECAALLDPVVGPTASAYVAVGLLAASWAAFPLTASPAVPLAFAAASLALGVVYFRRLEPQAVLDSATALLVELLP